VILRHVCGTQVTGKEFEQLDVSCEHATMAALAAPGLKLGTDSVC
jgi:hypothetical protein